MIGFFRRLFKDKRGNVLAIACACMPLVIGAAGLATDTIEWTLWKRQLQRAADSAAIAGVYDRVNATTSDTTTNTATAVCRDLGINLHTWMALLSTANPCAGTGVTYPADSGAMADQVNITLKIQQALPFSSFFSSFGFTAPIITASATAASITTGVPCMMALTTTGSGIYDGGGTKITAKDCILYSNSASANSAVATGSSGVYVKEVAAVGTIAASANWEGAALNQGAPPLPDPFKSVTPDPTQMHCAGHYVTSGNGKNATQTWVYDSLSESTNMSDATQQYMDSTGTVHTGIPNCWTSLSTSSSNKTGMTVPANFGPIYIDANTTRGGTGSVNMQGIFTCSGCTIVMTNSDSTQTTIGTWSANAGSQTNITAPTTGCTFASTGCFDGIAIYQDRRATAGNNDTINGGSSNVVNGAVYLPKSNLTVNGTGDATSICAMWIGDFITFSGNSGLAVSSPTDSQCSGITWPGGNASRMVRLVA